MTYKIYRDICSGFKNRSGLPGFCRGLTVIQKPQRLAGASGATEINRRRIMGKVNIYTAPVGAGKTHKAICDFTQRLSERDPLFSESHCYFIVPEQFSVDVEKKVLEKAKGCGFAGSEVISFTRLAHRIVAAENPGEKRVISKSARIMLLMDTVKKIESSLTFFKSCGERPASVSYLSDAIDELSKNGVETAVIEAAAADAELSYPED